MSSSTSDLCTQLVGDSGAQICPNLFIGDKKFASNLDALQALGITHVVNVTIDIRHYFERLEESTGHQPLTYVRYGCNDTELADLSEYFEEACKFIQSAIESGHAVLVHCQQGISRSATISIAYLMRHKGMTLTQAYTLLRTQRPVVKPKPNFLRQLAKFYDKLQLENSKKTHTQSTSQTVATGTVASSPTDSKLESSTRVVSASFNSALTSSHALQQSSNPSAATTTAITTVAASINSTPVGEKRSRAETDEGEITTTSSTTIPSSSSPIHASNNKAEKQNENEEQEEDRASKRQKVELEERKEQPVAAPRSVSAVTTNSAKNSKPGVSTSALVSLAMYADDDDDD